MKDLIVYLYCHFLLLFISIKASPARLIPANQFLRIYSHADIIAKFAAKVLIFECQHKTRKQTNKQVSILENYRRRACVLEFDPSRVGKKVFLRFTNQATLE